MRDMSPTRRWPLVALALARPHRCRSRWARRWWSIGDIFELGPFGARQCGGGECQTARLPLNADARWERDAVATGAACLIASLVLVLVAGAIAAGRTPRLLGKTTIVALATAAITGALFVALAPSLPDSPSIAGSTSISRPRARQRRRRGRHARMS